MLTESRKATEQACSVTRLTLLAFLFLPLSFTTSFFGINFRELDEGLNLWIWAATSIPLFVLVLVCYFWTDVLGTVRAARHRVRNGSV